MSRGNPHYKCRLDNATAELVERTIAFRNLHTTGEKWTVSDFLRIACREKVKKMNRSRRRQLTVDDEVVDLSLVAESAVAPDLFSEGVEIDGANA
jgi:hypothetical protein